MIKVYDLSAFPEIRQRSERVPSNAAYVRRKMHRQQESEPFSEQLRMEMLEAMCAWDCRLAADDCEYGRNGQAKTYETMETIQKKYPDALLYFVAGGDKLSVMPRWHRIEEFLEQFKILVVKRKGIEPERLIAANPFLSRHANAFAMLKEPKGLLGISSTKVRLLLKSGDATVEKLVHPGVWKLLLEAGNWNLDITRFCGDYDFLSNFYEVPLEYEGLCYKNAEAAFQAQKCEDAVQKADFCDLAANKAKKLGRRIKLRDDWENVKLKKMLEIVRAKFTQNPELFAIMSSDELKKTKRETGDQKGCQSLF